MWKLPTVLKGNDNTCNHSVPLPLESVWTAVGTKKNPLGGKLIFFFLPSPLCLPGNVAGSNLLEALSKAMKHLAAAVSIRMPLQFSFNQLAAVLREMGLQRHLCPRSFDIQPLAGTDALLPDRLQQDVWLGRAGRALAAPGAHT